MSRNQLKDCNCFTVRKAARVLTRLYEQHLAEAGLTSNQFSILTLLHGEPAMTIREMAAPLAMDRTTLVRTLHPLQRDGLVAAAPDEADARLLRYALTRLGMSRARQAVPLWQRAQTAFEQKVGKDAAAQLRKLSELADLDE